MEKRVSVPPYSCAPLNATSRTAGRLNHDFPPRHAALIVALLLFTCVSPSSWGQTDSVLTYHFDNNRSGQMTDETILVPSNVAVGRFGKLFSYTVDGLVVAQPLYVPNVSIGGVTHNVVYVVTQHDSVYAFDADNPGSGSPLWQVSFINAGAGVSTVPINEQLCNGTGFSEIGIMGTPVIDATTGTLYLSAKTRVAPGFPPNTSSTTPLYLHTLHALDITTGADKITPVNVDAVVPNGVGGTVEFDTNARYQCQRPGLLLSGGTLFVGYGSNGCDLNSHGWVMAYDPSTLTQLAAFNTAPKPDGSYKTAASLWMSGGGIAADSLGSLYLSTANGPFDEVPDSDWTTILNWGDSVLKLGFNNNDSISVTDFFTPFDQSYMGGNDLDLGSGGVTLLPDQPGVYPHLLVTSGKTGNIYLINRDAMGHYNPENQPSLNDNSQIVQYIPSALGLFDSTPVYWSGNSRVYFAARNGDPVKAFQLVNGTFSPSTPVAQSLKYAQAGVPVISSNGSTGGILWNIHNPATPYLSALDANTLAEMYNSNQAKAGKDTLGQIAHFASPAIANNKVYVGTTTNLSVYGVFPYLALLGGNAQSATVGTTLSAPLTVQALDSQGNGDANVSVNFSDNNAHGTFNPATATTDSTGTATTMYTVPTKAGTIVISASSTSTPPGLNFTYRNVLLSATATAGPATAIAKLSGVGQYGTVGTTLPAALVFDLRDADGNGIVGQQIAFTDNGAGGTLSANSVITGASGLASVTYTLPKTAKYIVITATFGSLVANSAEHSVAGPAASVNVVSGNNQSAPVNTQLRTPLTVSVTDQYGNAVAGVSVAFSDGGVGGTFSSPTVTTNNGGQATVTYTTPAQAQVVNISAAVSGLSPAMFTETVTSK